MHRRVRTRGCRCGPAARTRDSWSCRRAPRPPGAGGRPRSASRSGTWSANSRLPAGRAHARGRDRVLDRERHTRERTRVVTAGDRASTIRGRARVRASTVTTALRGVVCDPLERGVDDARRARAHDRRARPRQSRSRRPVRPSACACTKPHASDVAKPAPNAQGCEQASSLKSRRPIRTQSRSGNAVRSLPATSSNHRFHTFAVMAVAAMDRARVARARRRARPRRRRGRADPRRRDRAARPAPADRYRHDRRDRAVRRGSERTGAPVLPAIPVACSYGHGTELPGTLSLSPGAARGGVPPVRRVGRDLGPHAHPLRELALRQRARRSASRPITSGCSGPISASASSTGGASTPRSRARRVARRRRRARAPRRDVADARDRARARAPRPASARPTIPIAPPISCSATPRPRCRRTASPAARRRRRVELGQRLLDAHGRRDRRPRRARPRREAARSARRPTRARPASVPLPPHLEEHVLVDTVDQRSIPSTSQLAQRARSRRRAVRGRQLHRHHRARRSRRSSRSTTCRTCSPARSATRRAAWAISVLMTPNEDECVAMPDLATLRVMPWDRRFAWMAADLLLRRSRAVRALHPLDPEAAGRRGRPSSATR